MRPVSGAGRSVAVFKWRVRVALIVVVLLGLAVSWILGLPQDGLKELRRDRGWSPPPVIDEGSDTDEGVRLDFGGAVPEAPSAVLYDFDPFVTPSVSGIDLVRFREVVESLRDPEECPDAVAPDSLENVAEVLRLIDGCIVLSYEALDGRSVQDVAEGYVDDSEVLAVGRPTGMVLLADSHPEDPEMASQWHLDALNAEELWAGWPADAEVTVAVIDTGVDGTHRDLDDVLVVRSGRSSLRSRFDHKDLSGHGTHVAGIIAAELGNGVAGAGVAPGVSILSYKGIQDSHFSQLVQELFLGGQAALFQRAREDGAQVVNLSYALPPRQCQSDILLPCPVEYQIRLGQALGIIYVAAAGNCGRQMIVYPSGWGLDPACDNADEQQYPAAFPGVIAVAATNNSNNIWDGSTAASHVDIAAPGENILSTALNQGTKYDTGTSMAAPIVSGVIAHLIARFPDLHWSVIVEALYQTAHHPESEVWSKEFGFGIVRPLEAIDWLEDFVRMPDASERLGARERVTIDSEAVDYHTIEEATGYIPVMLLVDTSGSMEETVALEGLETDGSEPTKLEVVKNSIREVLSYMPTGRNVALRAFPDLGQDSDTCGVGGLRFGFDDRRKVTMNMVDDLSATGDTPTGRALMAAFADIQAAGLSEAQIILLSDGEETCDTGSAGPDYIAGCEAARRIKEAGIEVTVHTAGFQLSSEGRQLLECIAGVTGGTYMDAETPDDVTDVFEDRIAPDLGIGLDARVEVGPAAVPGVPPIRVEVVVRNDGTAAAPNVVVVLEMVEGAKRTRRPFAIGNVGAGETERVSWSLQPGFGGVGSDIGLEVSATVDGAGEPFSASTTVEVPDPNVADQAGPVLGAGRFVMMGDQLLSGVGTGSRGFSGGCRRSEKVGLLELFGQSSERSVACSNAVISHLTGPDGPRGVDSQIEQLGDITSGPDDVDGVMLSIGATDFGLSDLARQCATAPVPCDTEVSGTPTEEWLGSSIAGSGHRRATALEQIVRSLAAIDERLNGVGDERGSAPVLLLGQPRVFSFTSGACFDRWQPEFPPLITQGELHVYHYFVSAFNGVLEAAAAAARELGLPVFYVETTEAAYLPDHTACSSEPYVHTFEPLLEDGWDADTALREGGVRELVRADLDHDAVAAFNEEFLVPNALGEQALANAVLVWSQSEEGLEASEALIDGFGARTEGITPRLVESDMGERLLAGSEDSFVVEPGAGWTVTADGFRPGALVKATVEPAGLVVGSAIATEDGTADLFVVLSQEIAHAGSSVVLSGPDPSGEMMAIQQPVEVLPPLRPVHALALPALATVLLAGSFLLWRSARRAGTYPPSE